MSETEQEAAPKSTATNNVLYEDKYVKLTERYLVLKWYYFLTAASKTIPMGKIDKIWVGTDPELGLNFFRKKTWGMALSMIWWACRSGREFEAEDKRNFVLATKNERVRSGFSVENPETFAALVDKYMNNA